MLLRQIDFYIISTDVIPAVTLIAFDCIDWFALRLSIGVNILDQLLCLCILVNLITVITGLKLIV